MKENIVEMLESHDKDCVYLAVSMVRNSSNNIFDRKIINNIPLFDRIRTYSDVCMELNIKELTENDFKFLPKEQIKKVLAYHKIKNIIKLFNGNWKLNWNDTSQDKYYPYFVTGPVVVGGLVFHASARTSRSCAVVGYYKDKETSDFCGKTFIDIYNEL